MSKIISSYCSKCRANRSFETLENPNPKKGERISLPSARCTVCNNQEFTSKALPFDGEIG